VSPPNPGGERARHNTASSTKRPDTAPHNPVVAPAKLPLPLVV
jgi:hypothetical protein